MPKGGAFAPFTAGTLGGDALAEWPPGSWVTMAARKQWCGGLQRGIARISYVPQMIWNVSRSVIPPSLAMESSCPLYWSQMILKLGVAGDPPEQESNKNHTQTFGKCIETAWGGKTTLLCVWCSQGIAHHVVLGQQGKPKTGGHGASFAKGPQRPGNSTGCCQ